MAGDFLQDIGVKVPDLFAGLAGGVVRTLFDYSNFKPLVTILSAISGALTANYLAATFAAGFDKLFHSWFGVDLDHGVAGFIVGLTAMTLCQAIILRVRRWSGEKPNAT